jgi:hypothetical protein
MPRTHRSRTTAAGAALILSMLALALAACGSGGKSTASTTTAAQAATTHAPTTAPTPTTTAPAAKNPANSAALKKLSAGVEDLRKCLAKYGVPLPRGESAQAGGLFGNGKALPKGVTLAQAEAALQRCAGKGGTAKPGPIAGKALKGLGSNGKQLASGLDRFLTCLRNEGVKLAGSKGALGGLANLNLQDPKVKAAVETCSKRARAGK